MKLALTSLLLVAQTGWAAPHRSQAIRGRDSKCLEPAVEFLTSFFSADANSKIFVQRDWRKIPQRIDDVKSHGQYEYTLKRVFESEKETETVEFQGTGALIQIEGTLQRDGKCKITNRKFKSSHERRI